MSERVAIVGSRLQRWISTQAAEQAVRAAVAELPDETIVVSGGASGVDTWAEDAAKERGLPLDVYPPDYTRYGRRAPLERNSLIAAGCDRAIVFRAPGKSNGTDDVLAKLHLLGKPVEMREVSLLALEKTDGLRKVNS